MPRPAWFFSLVLAVPLVANLAGCGASPAPAATTAAGPCGAAGNDGLDALTEEQLARKILEVTGASDLGKQIGDAMLDSLRKMPNLPPGFIDRLKQDMHVEELTELIIPIYLKHYDRPTMIAAIRFYQSDPGRTMVKALPAVTAESTEIGKTWGANLAKKALGEMGVH
jgi:hypothetical protein